ncbi:MAG: HNH endonuclease [Anaerolineales bacterium]|nr:HNH endonuclease [Anaerolineales bacterium]
MGNYIVENREELEKFHYVRKADFSTDYWFSFNLRKLNTYISDFGEAFCLILIGSNDEEDSYIMPYSEVKAIFSDENLVPKGNRWVGSIHNDILRIHGTGQGIPVSHYHNNFQYLEPEDLYNSVNESKAQYSSDLSLPIEELKEKIRYFNEKYRNTVPHRRHSISEQVARPGVITNYLKQLMNYTCQICGSYGFKKKNGERYIEAHHVRELHELYPGSYCSDNIIIVCPTCHMKLHHAKVSYQISDENVIISINKQTYNVIRTKLTE